MLGSAGRPRSLLSKGEVRGPNPPRSGRKDEPERRAGAHGSEIKSLIQSKINWTKTAGGAPDWCAAPSFQAISYGWRR